MSKENNGNGRIGTYPLDRRAALKHTAGLAAGATALAGLGSRTVVADKVTWFSEGDTVYDDERDEYVAGMELAASGPDDSNVNGPLSCGLGFGLSALGYEDTDNEYEYHINDPYFSWYEHDTPSDTSVDVVTHYGQEDHDETIDKVMQYIIDAMWNVTPIPAPNPVNYLDNNPSVDLSYHDDRDGFTSTWPTVYGNDDVDGTLFDLTMGASGACETGTYEYYVTGYADVSRWDGISENKHIGTLSPYAYVTIELTDC